MRSLYNIVTLCFFVSITISITVTFTATTVSCFTLPNSNSYRMGKKTVVRKDIVKNKLSNNSAIRTRNSNNRSYGTGVLASSSNSDGNSGVTPTMSDVAKVADPSNSIGNSGGNSGGNDTEPQQKQLSLDFSQLKPFLRIAIPFFKEDEVARSSIIGVTALTLLNSGISVAFSYVSRDFYNALNSRDESLFYEKIMLFFIYLILAVPVSVYYRFIREKLSIYWREALTAKVLDKYYSNRSFYILETLREVDNPDQRITEDIRHFTKTSLDFFITIFTSIIDLFSFSAILFQIYPGLFVAIILYAGIGSVITTKLGQSLVELNYKKLVKEADFRFGLFRTRENAEAIAFYDSDAKLELDNVLTLFQEVLKQQLGIAIVERDLEFFTTSYRYIVQILPSLIVAPLYFANKVELGAISQSYGAFNHILGDFSIIINQFESLSKFSAGLNRLVTFIDKIDECKGWGSSTSTSVVATNGDITSHSGVTDFNSSLIGMRVVGPNSMLSLSTVSDSTSAVKNNQIPTFDSNKEVILKCSDLTVLTPDRNRVLLGQVADLSLSSQYKKRERGVELEVYNGDKLLIVGPSGAGKSSLVRAIAGLWQVGGGTINWSDGLYPANSLIANAITNLPANQTGISIASAPKSVFFLPQKPYNFLGTLREQIMYPKVERNTALKKSLSSTAFSNIGESSTKAKFSSIYNAKLPIDSIVRTISKDDYAGEDHSDDYFLELLEKVRLGDLAARMGNGDPIQGLDSNKDWSKVLSLGEQQRLAFARVMYNKPQVVVLDEATSALDLKSEEAMYKNLEESKVTYLSVGHRPTLLRYHSHKLILSGAGSDPQRVPIDLAKEELSSELIDLSAR